MIYENLTTRQQIDVAWLAIAEREEQESYTQDTPELTMLVKNRIWIRGGVGELALLESAVDEYIDMRRDQDELDSM